jgi:hypothetical protein
MDDSSCNLHTNFHQSYHTIDVTLLFKNPMDGVLFFIDFSKKIIENKTIQCPLLSTPMEQYYLSMAQFLLHMRSTYAPKIMERSLSMEDLSCSLPISINLSYHIRGPVFLRKQIVSLPPIEQYYLPMAQFLLHRRSTYSLKIIGKVFLWMIHHATYLLISINLIIP